MADQPNTDPRFEIRLLWAQWLQSWGLPSDPLPFLFHHPALRPRWCTFPVQIPRGHLDITKPSFTDLFRQLGLIPYQPQSRRGAKKPPTPTGKSSRTRKSGSWKQDSSLNRLLLDTVALHAALIEGTLSPNGHQGYGFCWPLFELLAVSYCFACSQRVPGCSHSTNKAFCK